MAATPTVHARRLTSDLFIRLVGALYDPEIPVGAVLRYCRQVYFGPVDRAA